MIPAYKTAYDFLLGFNRLFHIQVSIMKTAYRKTYLNSSVIIRLSDVFSNVIFILYAGINNELNFDVLQRSKSFTKTV